ncbi:MAG: hypothetical protein J6K92_12015 [Oscillospiraceae bacterium]|nr:hypothetical protein [Oscillospiraceae bacterium]
MTKHGFISSYKYQLRRNILPPVLSVAAAIAAMLMMTGLINYSLDGKFSLENGGIVCLDALSGLMFFLFGIVFFHEFLNTGAGNGVSRTTTLAAASASFFTSSVISSLFISAVSPIINFLCRGDGDYMMLELFYGTKRFYQFYGENPFVVRIRFFIMCTLLLFFCSMIGLALSSVYYRLSRKGATILTTALLIIFIIGYPVLDTFLSQKGIDLDEKLNALSEAFGRLFGMAHVNGSQAGNCVQGVLMMLLFSAAFAFIAWLFVRRSGVKPAPIRGD